MAKAAYVYGTDTGHPFAYLQDTATAAALGATPAPVGTDRLPHKLKPRRVSIRMATGGPYKHLVVGDVATYSAIAFGSSVLGGIVCGKDGEVDNSETSS